MSARYYYSGIAPLAVGSPAELDPEESKHLLKVMRAKPGDSMIVFGRGGQFRARLEAATAGRAIVRPTEALPCTPQPSVAIVSLVPWIKGGKTEFAVQKLTELGVDRIVVFHAAREVARGDADKIARLQRVALEACKQCERDFVPSISAGRTLADAVAAQTDVPVHCRFVMHERGGDEMLGKAAGECLLPGARVLLANGPEGGWDSAEIDALGGQARLVSLGPRILRAETAAIAGAAALLALAGDF